jgi:hypothetical protein
MKTADPPEALIPLSGQIQIADWAAGRVKAGLHVPFTIVSRPKEGEIDGLEFSGVNQVWISGIPTLRRSTTNSRTTSSKISSASSTVKSSAADVFGRIYEYFLMKFAIQGRRTMAISKPSPRMHSLAI